MFENKEMLPFEELTVEQRNQVVVAWLDNTLEVYRGCWYGYEYVHAILRNSVYRIPAKKLEIPWDIIDKKWQWVAMDENGIIHFYEEEPMRASSFWVSGKGHHCMNALAIQTTGVNWEISKQKRP